MRKHFHDVILGLKLPFLHLEILSVLLLPIKRQFFYLRVKGYKSRLWVNTALLVGDLDIPEEGKL